MPGGWARLAGAPAGRGTPNRRRIALQMVKDMLDESSFDASPARPVPGKVGRAAAKVAGRLRRDTGEEPR